MSDIMISEDHEPLAKKSMRNSKNQFSDSEKACEQNGNRWKTEQIQLVQTPKTAQKLKNGEKNWNGDQNNVGVILRSICETLPVLKKFIIW